MARFCCEDRSLFPAADGTTKHLVELAFQLRELRVERLLQSLIDISRGSRLLGGQERLDKRAGGIAENGGDGVVKRFLVGLRRHGLGPIFRRLVRILETLFEGGKRLVVAQVRLVGDHPLALLESVGHRRQNVSQGGDLFLLVAGTLILSPQLALNALHLLLLRGDGRAGRRLLEQILLRFVADFVHDWLLEFVFLFLGDRQTLYHQVLSKDGIFPTLPRGIAHGHQSERAQNGENVEDRQDFSE